MKPQVSNIIDSIVKTTTTTTTTLVALRNK